MRIEYIIGGILVAGLVIATYFLDPLGWFEPDAPALEETQILTPEPVIGVEPSFDPSRIPPVEPGEEPLPPLNESDLEVREDLAILSVPSKWIEQEELIRRLAVVLDNSARSTYPRGQLGFLAPAKGFKANRAGDQYRLDPQSYRRYDTLVSQAVTIPPSQMALFLTRYGPLVQMALGELGNKQSWREQLSAGITELLAVPILQEDIMLTRPKVLYLFADPELESLSDLQKQLLRTGPRNVSQVQDYLRELSLELRLRPAALKSAETQ